MPIIPREVLNIGLPSLRGTIMDYDTLSAEGKRWYDFLADNSSVIDGLYRKKWWRNGGWNGMVDAIDEAERIFQYHATCMHDKGMLSTVKHELEDGEFEFILEETLGLKS